MNTEAIKTAGRHSGTSAPMVLRAYRVRDSKGGRHIIWAHYTAQPQGTQTVNFVNVNRPNMGVVASFTNPRYIKEV